jgi:hypothetical protein
LVVDHDSLTLGRVRRVIQAARPSWALLRAESAAAALQEVEAWGSVDVLVTGPMNGEGIELLQSMRNRFPTAIRILHSDLGSSPERVDSEVAANSEEAMDSAHVLLSPHAPTDELLDTLDQAVGAVNSQTHHRLRRDSTLQLAIDPALALVSG